MSIMRLLLLAAAVTLMPAQAALFECQGATTTAPVPVPPIGSPDCEGLVSNASSVGGVANIEARATCGMPAQGSGFLHLTSALNPTVVPVSGPLPRPLVGTELEVRIPIPAGANGISFSWDFLDASISLGLGPPFLILDGCDISVVDALGNGLVNLVFASSTTVAPAPGGCFSLIGIGTDTGVDGPEFFASALPALPAGAYLSVVLFASASFAGLPGLSTVTMDGVLFTTGQVFSLNLSAPFGPGSFQIQNVAGTPLAPYVTLLTVNQGSFPNGALGGLDILPSELIFELSFGAPPSSGPSTPVAAPPSPSDPRPFLRTSRSSGSPANSTPPPCSRSR